MQMIGYSECQCLLAGGEAAEVHASI